MVDTTDLKSVDLTSRVGSSPTTPNKNIQGLFEELLLEKNVVFLLTGTFIQIFTVDLVIVDMKLRI